MMWAEEREWRPIKMDRNLRGGLKSLKSQDRVILVGGIVICSLLFFLHSIAFWVPLDDSFISFRYAEHLVAGKGLVFNPGERVQGYTNLLWVLLIAAGHWLGGDSLRVAQGLGIFFNLGTLVVTFFMTAHLTRQAIHPLNFLPPLLLALTSSFVAWGSSGLETPLFVFLVTLGFFLYIRNMDQERGFVAVSIVFSLAFITRPDSAIFFFALALHWLWSMMLQVRPLKPFPLVRASFFPRLTPFLSGIALWGSVVLGFCVWSQCYYGYPLPNTFYLKTSAAWSPPLLRKGVAYLVLFLESYPLLALGFIYACIFNLRHRSIRGQTVGVLTLGMALWGLYVIGIGSDYMPFFRFLIVWAPSGYVLLVASFDGLVSMAKADWVRLIQHPSRWKVATMLILGTTTVAPSWKMQQGWVRVHRELYSFRREVGEWLQRHNPPGTLIAVNPAGVVPYYSRLPSIDMLGLNDAYLAHNGHFDPSLMPGHQVGEGSYVLSRQPDLLFLGQIRKNSFFQKWHWEKHLDQVYYLGDREIVATDEFWRDYEFLRQQLPSGCWFGMFRRHTSKGHK